MNEQPRKPGLLCEDANALEVTDTRTGQESIIKTPDRQRASQGMCEANCPLKPTHSESPTTPEAERR